MDREFEVGRCKLFHLEWISNEILLYNKSNYIQSFGTEHDRRQINRRKRMQGVRIVAQQVKKPTSIHVDRGLIPGLIQWVKDPVLL